MQIMEKKWFDALKTAPTPNEPVADEVGVHKLSTMIAKKTKFRVVDVEEVIKEATYAIYAMLLERKTVNLDSVKIKTRWNPYDEPKYIRNGDGFWTFGCYMPKVELSKDGRLIYAGKNGEFSDKFIEGILPYLPDDINDEDDIISMSNGLIESTCKLGKDVIIDKDGYIVQKNPKKKRRYFDETFHPSYVEMVAYHIARKKALKEANELKSNGAEIEVTQYVKDKLIEQGFKIGADKEGKPDEL